MVASEEKEEFKEISTFFLLEFLWNKSEINMTACLQVNYKSDFSLVYKNSTYFHFFSNLKKDLLLLLVIHSSVTSSLRFSLWILFLMIILYK